LRFVPQNLKHLTEKSSSQRLRLGEGWEFCVTSASAHVLLLIKVILFSPYSSSPTFAKPMLAASLRPVQKKLLAKNQRLEKILFQTKMCQIVLFQQKNICQLKGLKIYFVPVKTFALSDNKCL